jgi:hypothetical protein
MKSFTNPMGFFFLKRFSAYAIFTFFISLFSSNILIAQSARLDQWQKIDASWEYGNLNRKHSSYVEDESVPYRIFMSGLTDGVQRSIVFSFDITGTNNSPVKHGIDYLTSFNRTIGNPPFDDATVKGDVPAGFVFPASASTPVAIPAPTNLSFLGGVSQGDMIMFGGTIDAIVYDDEGDPTSSHATATVRVTFTPDGEYAVLLYGGHLAREQDYDANGDADFTNDGDGAGGIHGSPYHMALNNFDGPFSQIGNQDRSVQVGLPGCDLPGDCFDDLYACPAPGETTATFDLTASTCTVAGWYTDLDFNDPIADPANFVASDGDVVYGKISNDCGNSTAYATLHLNSLPTVTADNKQVCYGNNCVELTGTPAGGTWSGTGVSGTQFCANGLAVGNYTVTYTVTDGCTNTATATVTINALPTIGTLTPASTCSGTSNGSITLTGCESGVNYQLKKCSDNSNVQGVKTCSSNTVTWTGLAADCYYFVATNTTTQCSNTSGNVTVSSAICNTTLTQGFYGNLGGKDCNNRTAIQVITAAVGGSNKTFGAGCKSFTLKPSDLTGSKPNIFKMLPGGTTPAVLGCVPSSGSGANACFTTNASANGGVGTATFDCKPSWQYVTIQNGGSKDGSINNVLLAQTMTLFFNLSNSGNLGAVVISGNKLTFNNLDCGSSTPGSFASIQYIPCSVFNYLTAHYTGAGHPNIADLYDLANKVLGGVALTSPNATISASDMNAALKAINVGFDKGKALVSQENTCSGPVTSRDTRGIQEAPVTDLSVSAYPNPYSNKVNFIISSPVAGKAKLQVFNLVGQHVKTVFDGYLQAGQTQTVSFDVPTAMQSMLIYKLQVGDKQITGKILQAK